MGLQTNISEQNGASRVAPKALARDVGEFAHDVLTLAELQAQLFAADAQECGRRVLVPGLALLCGVVLGLTCLPLALAALARSRSFRSAVPWPAFWLSASERSSISTSSGGISPPMAW